MSVTCLHGVPMCLGTCATAFVVHGGSRTWDSLWKDCMAAPSALAVSLACMNCVCVLQCVVQRAVSRSLCMGDGGARDAYLSKLSSVCEATNALLCHALPAPVGNHVTAQPGALWPKHIPQSHRLAPVQLHSATMVTPCLVATCTQQQHHMACVPFCTIVPLVA